MSSIPPGGSVAPSDSSISHVTGANDGARAASVAGDILYGADEIALFLFGDRKHRRRVYSLVESNALPTFRIGVSICARKSALLRWISRQECGEHTQNDS